MMRLRWLLALVFIAGHVDAATIARGTTWTNNQVLTHSALNSEFDIAFNEINGSLSAANLAADSVASSELLETDDYTMQNLILSTTGPDVRWNPTSGDSFHAGAEYSAAGGSIWFLSNVTDSQHYIRVRNDHLMELPQYPSCTAGLTTGAGGKVICNTSIADWDIGGSNAARVHRTSGDVTTSSTTLVDFTGANITLTTKDNPLQIGFVGACRNNNNGVNNFNVRVDGDLILGTTGLEFDNLGTAINNDCSFVVQTAALTAGSHTARLQWSVSSGADTATTDCDTGIPCQFWVMEVRD